MKPHKNLIAWQKSMDLVVAIYDLTRDFPKEETYGLSSQLRRAAVSVPSNIAEGACDRTTDQLRNFVSISIGSLNEMNTQIELALRLRYIDQSSHDDIQFKIDECLALTFGLKKSLLRAQA